MSAPGGRRPSVRSRLLTAGAQRLAGPYLRKLAGQATASPELLARLARVDGLAARVPRPRGARVERVTVPGPDGGIAAEWVHGRGVPASRTRALLYLHGGGWLFGGLNTHRGLAARISTACRMPALVLDYRMVPSVSLDQEIDDCVSSYRWLLGHGARSVVIIGDSAGAHLTMSTALRIRAHGLPGPAALVGLSGVYDLDSAARNAHVNARLDPTGSLAALDWMIRAVLGGTDPASPRVSPLRADLGGLPPVLLVASSSEVVLSDSEQLARRLASAGVPCTLRVWPDQLHVFPALGRLVPEARRAVTEIGEFVQGAIT